MMSSILRKSNSQKMDANVICISFENRSFFLASFQTHAGRTPVGDRS